MRCSCPSAEVGLTACGQSDRLSSGFCKWLRVYAPGEQPVIRTRQVRRPRERAESRLSEPALARRPPLSLSIGGFWRICHAGRAPHAFSGE